MNVKKIVPQQNVFKFRVTDGLGNSSAVWRVWTGSNKPTDDTYLAPAQIVGDIKISLHKDGYCQMGPTRQLRDNSFDEDRQAFARWEVDWRQVPCPLVMLEFSKSQFQPMTDVADDAVQAVVLPSGAEALLVIVMKAPVPDDAMSPPEMPGSWTEATLARADPSTVISIVGVCVEEAQARLSDVRAMVSQTPREGWSVWKMPVDWPDSPFSWAVSDPSPVGHVPILVEFAAEQPSDGQPILRGFNGDVEPWEDCPVNLPSGVDVCAVLIVTGASHLASLYLNQHARCDHGSLAADADRVLEQFRRFGPDEGWDMLHGPDGMKIGWRTALATPHAAIRSSETRVPPKYRQRLAQVEEQLGRRNRHPPEGKA